MCASLVNSSCIKLLRYCPVFLPRVPKTLPLLTRSRSPRTLLLGCSSSNTSPFASFAHSSTRSEFPLSPLFGFRENFKKLRRKRNLYCHCFYWFNYLKTKTPFTNFVYFVIIFVLFCENIEIEFAYNVVSSYYGQWW